MSLQAINIRHRIKACNYCATCKDGMGPIPMEMMLGGLNVRVAVLVPEPLESEIQRGRLYYDIPGAKMLRGYMSQNFEPDEVAYIPVQGCRGSRANCRVWLEQQLYSLPNLSSVLLPGKDVMESWRPELTLKHYMGHIGVMLDRWWCMPIVNPDSVLKRYEDRKTLVRQLEDFVAVTNGVMTPEGFFQYDCPVKRCGFEGTHMDRDRVWYCDRHWKDHGGQWKKVRKQWSQEMTVVGKIRLWD